jgi:hypothetical protein
MRLLLPATAVLGLAAFGCSATVSATPEQGDAEAASQTAALVTVQRTDVARSEAVARFMRIRGRQDAAEALRAVGGAVDLPALGTCVSLASVASANATPTPSVQLLDVGSVSMEANGVQTALFARQVPDVVDVVSGIVYARAAEAEMLPARTRYTIRVGGAADADAFVVEATAPADLADLRVSGQDARAVALAPGAAADLAWSAGAADDLIYVDINGSSLAGSTLRCAFADTGSASVAAALLPDEGSLAIHRLHRERFHTGAIDGGEVRFDFAKVVSFSRR